MSRKKEFIVLAVSSVLMAVFLYLWLTFQVGTSGYGRYYLSAALSISVALVVIFLIRMGRHRIEEDGHSKSVKKRTVTGVREHYRLQYDTAQRPIFIRKTDPERVEVEFACPVIDISETGICLDVAGVYTPGTTICGEIIFNSGRSAPINGVVVREAMDRTSVKLHCTISPPLLMAEQRDLIASRKDDGPRPAVNRQLLKTGGTRLPSHTPKGICLNRRR